jgi:Holliday junction resolvasome RuvABC endonuclease subunit
MVTTLLPAAANVTDDAADALAVAICHAHLRRNQQIMAQVERDDTRNRTGRPRRVGA